MSSIGYSQIRSKSSQNTNKRSVSSLQKYFLLFKLIAEYSSSFDNSFESAKSDSQSFTSRNQRLSRINNIISFIDRLKNEQLCLQESDKHQCLIQSLHIIKKLNHILTKNQIETRSKRTSSRKEQEAIQQLQRSVMQKIAQFILTSLYPKKKSVRAITSLISTIISQLYEYYPNQKEKDLDKQKTKKPHKKIKTQASSIDCFLQNGSKINLVCYLVFRILQKNLEELHQIKAKQDRDANENDRTQVSMSQIIEKYINQYINEVISRVIIQHFQELSLLKLFLSCTVQNIHQMQLPIIPFFLNAFKNIIQTKFKTYLVVTYEKDHQQKISSKDVFSLQIMNILLSLAEIYSNQLIFLQSSKQTLSSNAVCSYCGILRQNLIQRLCYQKISLKLSDSQNLLVTVCEKCCKNLNVKPASQMNLRLLGPLILSQFWNSQFDKNRVNKIKDAISNFVKLYPAGKNCYESKEKFDRLFVSDKIAMNNVEESISKTLIQKIYNTFVFFHTELSIQSILIEVVQILTIFWTTKDEKLREKSVKILSKSAILEFLYNQQFLSVPQYASQLNQATNLIIKGLCLRFKDSFAPVALVSLEFIIQIYLKKKVDNQIFQEAFAYLVQSKNRDFQVKAFDVLERLFCKNKQKNKQNFDVISYMQMNLRILKLCLECLRKDGEQHLVFKEKVSKTLALVLGQIGSTFQSLYSQAIQAKLKSIFEQFYFCLGFRTKINETQQIIKRGTLLPLLCLKLDSTILKNLPIITPWMLSQILQLPTFFQMSQQTSELILKNIIFIIREVYNEVFRIKQNIFGLKRKETLVNKNSLSLIVNYVHSSAFFQVILQETRINESEVQHYKLPQRHKLEILKQLLYLNNLNQLFSSRKQITKYFSILQKSKRKNPEVLTSLPHIILRKDIEQSLDKLSMKLLQAIKSADITQLQFEVSLIVSIKWLLGKTEEIKGLIQIYEKYCMKFFSSFILDLSYYQTNKDENVYKQMVAKYVALTRCLHISTFFVSSFEEYLLGQQKVSQFYQNKISFMGKQMGRRVLEKENSNTECITTSISFKNLYLLTINFLEKFDQIVRDDDYLIELYQKVFLLLRLYFEVNPKTIFMQPKLLSVLNKINEKEIDSFIIIKHMYKLFETLLPSNNLELLNFIRDQFSKRFHELIKTQNGRRDNQFLETAFSIIYHLLRSGMEGLYAYNKYLYFGILHSSQKINHIAQKLIRQMYADQASEKILYFNMSQSLEFVYELFFKNQQSTQFQYIQLTENQKNNLSMLSEIGKLVDGQYVNKNKKQIKLSSTFIKKVGAFLGNNPNLIKEKPLFFITIIKILKCQKIADFTQINQLLFWLGRLTNLSQSEVQNLINLLKEKANQDSDLNSLQHQNHIVLAYRQLVSCLAYYSKYQQVRFQIKNNQKLLETTLNPYSTLQEEIQMIKILETDSSLTKITKLQSDISAFIGIVVDGVQHITKKEQLQSQQESSRETQKTKLKGKGDNQRKRKNKPTKCRPKSVQQCVRQQQSENQVFQLYRNRLRKQTRKQLNQEVLLQS